MTWGEYQKRLDGVILDLQGGEHLKIMQKTVMDAVSMIKKRIQEKGENSEGGKYRDYEPSYLEYKKKEGKYKGYTDFSFTNQMWKNTTLKPGSLFYDRGVIGALSQENEDKLAKNTERFGKILALSNNEKKGLSETYDKQILNIFRKNGL